MSTDLHFAAQAVIERAMKRHGGRDRYEQVESIICKVYSLSGFGMSRRGVGRNFPMPDLVTIMPRHHMLVLHDYAGKGRDCVYDNGKVAVVAASEKPVFEADNYRTVMMSVSRLGRPWNTLEATYFFGYAMTHYGSLPFSLQGVEVLAMKTRTTGDWRTRIDFRYPEGSHTHSPIETMYFDASDLLVRHDYRPEVSSPVARAANFLLEYKSFDGFLVTERRKVFFRLGRLVTPLVVLDGGVRVLEVTTSAPRGHVATA
jgi:hypothetical protein